MLDRAAPLCVQLMGTFRVRRYGVTVPVPRSAARVVATVGLHGPVTRTRVAGRLWPTGTQTQAMANLRSTLSRLGAVVPGLVVAQGELLELADDVRLDVHDVLDWAHAVIDQASSGSCDRPHPPLSTGSELLTDWDEDWLVDWRERVRVLQTQALETVAERLVAGGHVIEALPYALTAVQAQPWSESAAKLLIEIHVRRGDPSSALREFHKFRRALHEELGVAPGTEIAATIRQLYPFGAGEVHAV